MDFLLDPRVWVPAFLAFIGFVGAWSTHGASVKKLAKDVETIRDKEIADARREIAKVASDSNRNAIDIAKLQSDHKTHGDKLNDVVTQLRQVVRDLQDVAIKLASEGHGKA